MADDVVVPTAPSSVAHAPVMATPTPLSTASGSAPTNNMTTDSVISSTDSVTRRALEARLDVTNVAAKAAGSGSPAVPVVTCTVNHTPGKPSTLINSVAHLPLTEFHSPNVTSVIDAATNNPLPNAANKNAAAKLQEQLMLGAAQRITSTPASAKSAAAARTQSDGQSTGPPNSPPCPLTSSAAAPQNPSAPSSASGEHKQPRSKPMGMESPPIEMRGVAPVPPMDGGGGGGGGSMLVPIPVNGGVVSAMTGAVFASSQPMPVAVPGASVAIAAAATHDNRIVSPPSTSRVTSPQQQQQGGGRHVTTSPYSVSTADVSTAHSAGGGGSTVMAQSSSLLPAAAAAGGVGAAPAATAVPMAALTVANQQPPTAMFNGQQIPVVENHIPLNANHFSASSQAVAAAATAAALPGQVAAAKSQQQQHRPVYPYFIDPECMPNGFPPGMYMSSVSSAGQFIPPGMAVCAPPPGAPAAMVASAPAGAVRPVGPPAPGQPMTYLSRAIMMPSGVVQIDGANGPQYYYQQEMVPSIRHMNEVYQQQQQQQPQQHHHQQQQQQQVPALVAASRNVPPVGSGGGSDPPSERHSRAASPTTSPLPGILRKRNHDGTRKMAPNTAADRSSFSNGITTNDQVNGTDSHADQHMGDLSRTPSKGGYAMPGSGRALDFQHRGGGGSTAASSSKSQSAAALKALHASSSSHRSSSISTTVQATLDPGFRQTSSSKLAVPHAAGSTSDVVGPSPRKKPRKQTVKATEDPLASNVPTGNTLPGEFRSGSASSRQVAASVPAPKEPVVQVAAKPQKAGIHQFPFRRRMNVAYGGGYVPRGKTALNHFVRASDVKVKDEKKTSLSDVASKVKGHPEMIEGNRIHHVLANIDAICKDEKEKADRYSTYFLAEKWKDDPDIKEDVDGIMDLLQGNVLRSKALIDQLTEVKQTLLKVLDHTRKVKDITARVSTQKSKKKNTSS
ncbi:histone deacetylase complex subunit SAP130-like isoform X1 [Sycon ciliatum]|uniref:histone deacetylase complex subunit SAP130-like isoform X1 n=1 Tax=Sycon ciliatum TaxID=27933 RepID=UPI0031F6AA47